MIADTAVFSSSPWGSDMLFNKDLFMFNQTTDTKMDSYNFDVDVPTLEAELEKMKAYSNNIDLRHLDDTLNSASCSVAGSDYSDEACLDFDGHVTGGLFPVAEDQEYLSSSLSHLLGGPIAENGLLNWTDEGDDDDESSPSSQSVSDTTSSQEEKIDIEVEDTIIPSIPSSPTLSTSPSPSTSRSLKRKQCCILDDTKLWCEMCDEEQITTVEELSQIISVELGLREQLDVIRIIFPEANIRPNDTEFVIDLDYLDDDKLQQVRDYIRQHKRSVGGYSLTSCDNCNETNSPVQKKHTKKQTRDRRSQQKELRQRQRKEYRQRMKERRSGLFAQEEVLSLTTKTSREDLDPDENDIDILG